MPEILDDIAYLSQEIGPRPAGREEEQQAALYIADQFKKRVGLRAQIEDFSCNSNSELVNVILFALPIIFSILAMIRNIFVIPTILVALLCAVLFVLEVRNRPILSKAMQRGLSQNVIAKYRPEGVRGKRSRKIIVVANYDSGKIQQELALGNGLGILQKVNAAALILIPIVWIIRAIFALGATGTTLIVWNVIVIVLLILALPPIVLFIMHATSQYNEAANSNAAGVAALIELADRINNTFIEDESEAEIYGEDAAREEGLIPEGAEVDYAVPAKAEPEEPEQTEEERLQSAKAAIAALTGKPLREYAPTEVKAKPESFELEAVEDYQQEEPAAAIEQPIVEQPAIIEAAPETIIEEAAPEQDQLVEAPEQEPVRAQYVESPMVNTVGTPIPDWYRKAQEKADKSHQDETPVRRSRYASALDEAVATSRAFFDAANRSTGREEAFFEQRFGSGITEVSAPEQESPAFETPPLDFVAPQPEPEEFEPEEFEDTPIIEEQPLAADFMVEQPEAPKSNEEENTAPIPTVMFGEDEYVPGATRAMAPIDVNELRSSLASSSHQAARDLQAKPSRDVEPARRRDVDRIVYDGTGEIPEPIGVNSSLDLPEVESTLPPISELHKQRAPLADASNPSLSSQIPRINLDAFGVSTKGNAQPVDNKRAALRSMLPSMSGSITVEPDLQVESKNAVSMTGSFSSIGATGTGSVGAVGDELVEGLAPEEVYVDDADDSFTENSMTETGAYAGPGYMEMPDSRASRFFGRFRKKDKKKTRDTTAQEWLDVEDDFNPTEAGAARGGWESFSNDDQGRVSSNRRADDTLIDDDEWNGGAFSKLREVMPGKDADEFMEESTEEEVEAAPARRPRAETRERRAVESEIDQIEGFYAKKMEMEVWFVALGSELAGNGGIKAFLAEHSGDLRGSVIINLDSLGCGEFVYLESEGAILQKSPSSRMRRYMKKAQEACGVEIGDASINWRESAASVAMKRGIQAITIAGVEGSKPAKMAQGDDVVEDIDEYALYDRIDFAEAVIRSI